MKKSRKVKTEVYHIDDIFGSSFVDYDTLWSVVCLWFVY